MVTLCLLLSLLFVTKLLDAYYLAYQQLYIMIFNLVRFLVILVLLFKLEHDGA